MPTIDLVALGKWLAQPKSWLKLALLVALVWGSVQLYGFIYDRGAASRDKEVATLTTERNDAITQYTEYKAEYDNWVTNTKNAQAQFMREQADLISQLTKSLSEAEERYRNKPTTIKEVVRYVPAEVDARYPLPVGFLRLYVETLQGPTAAPASGPFVPGSFSADVGEASPIALSQFGLIAGSNNAECVLRGEIIHAWQEWYFKVKKMYEGRQDVILDGAPIP